MIKLIDILNIMDRSQEITVHFCRRDNAFSTHAGLAQRVLPDDILQSRVERIEGDIMTSVGTGVIHMFIKIN